MKRNSVFTTLGASNHTAEVRQADDYYATDAAAVDGLLEVYDLPKVVWECACGEGHLAERLKQRGCWVVSTDIIDRGYGQVVDFLQTERMPIGCRCVLTNPPYKLALEFVQKALDLLPDGGVCAMFLKTTFLEGQKRWSELFRERRPRYVFQFVKRVLCAKNADFARMVKGGGSAVAYAWFVWEKGYVGDTVVRWIA